MFTIICTIIRGHNALAFTHAVYVSSRHVYDIIIIIINQKYSVKIFSQMSLLFEIYSLEF